jgi:hypothetical protein
LNKALTAQIRASRQREAGTEDICCARKQVYKEKAHTLAKVSIYPRHKNFTMTMLYVKISTVDIQKWMDEAGDPILNK